MGKPTVGECTCNSKLNGVYQTHHVKEYVRYRIDDLPFTTARKINHERCVPCQGIIAADSSKEFVADLNKNRAFILEQDQQYKYQEGVTYDIILINDSKRFAHYLPPTHNKQWHKGVINYLRYMQTADSVRIVPASESYEVYSNEQDALRVAVAQFVKPDDYFKLTSVQYNQPKIATFQPARYGDA